MYDLCKRYLLPTQFTTVEIIIPEKAQPSFKIPNKLQTDIGLIFGMSIYADAISASNQTEITTTEAGLLYLNFKKGSSDFIDTIKLTDLLYQFSGVPVSSGEKFNKHIQIPQPFDLDQSSIINPTLIVSPAGSPKVISLNLYFININVWNMMLNKLPELQVRAEAERLLTKK